MGVFAQWTYQWLDCILFLSHSLQALNIAASSSCQITDRKAKQSTWELKNSLKSFLTFPTFHVSDLTIGFPACREDTNILHTQALRLNLVCNAAHMVVI